MMNVQGFHPNLKSAFSSLCFLDFEDLAPTASNSSYRDLTRPYILIAGDGGLTTPGATTYGIVWP
jgi:hypothetical protein